MAIKKFIPNFVTLLNLLCGSIAAIFAVHNNFIYAAIFVFLGIFFDFFDGLLARKLHVQSELGVQLDSLADMVTSGLVPGIVMYKLLLLSSDAPEIATVEEWNAPLDHYIPIVAFVGLFITLASGYRLAKFNIDDEQQTYFKGLPTPANALLIMSLPLIIEFQHQNWVTAIILNQWFLIFLTCLSCYLLNSNIKLLALKFKDFSFNKNKYRYILLALALTLLLILHFTAIPLIILIYILISLIDNLTTKA
ncbi:CDP-alcohol phosphatidyltransferase family protein [Psychroserpens sp. BH13MA-6]